MNPADWDGPTFLAGYLVLAILLFTACAVVRRHLGTAMPRLARLSDPYAIAYLRGGAAEAARVAVVSLLQRELLVQRNTSVRVEVQTTAPAHAFEGAVLAAVGVQRPARDVVEDRGIARLAAKFDPLLEREGLLQTRAQLQTQRLMAVGVGVALLAIASARIGQTIQRGHANIGFLIVLAMAAGAVATWLTLRPERLTAAGRRFLEDLRRLARRARSVRTDSEPREVLMMLALLGVTSLGAPNVRRLFPRAAAGGSCGSSCGSMWSGSSCGSSSSCGGGSGCGSGGCGGGGCGGGGCGGG